MGTQQNITAGDSKRITRAYFDRLLVEMRLMDAQLPSCDMEIFGEHFSTPIMTTALSHLGKFNPDMPSGMEQYAKGACLANTLHWVGMCENEEYGRIADTGAKCVRVIKPYEDEDKIYDQIAFAKQKNAVAIGMDIDHMIDNKGQLDIVMGEKMAIKSSEQLKSYMKAADLPFVIKGVLSVRDAAKAAEMGASAILVSHHGGRIKYAVPPLMVLPEIAKEVKGSLSIIVDCGIESGLDAYKALALGADGVGVGNHLVPFIRSGGAEGVAKRFEEMTEELKGMMAYTGVKDVLSFDASVIHTIEG